MSFKKLVEWSEDFNHLPWRINRSLYNTLVSEIMLQQTTVGTVLGHFDRFIKIYPNLKALSETDEETIQINWKGLGYYRRARNLLNAAKYIQEEFNGEIPLELETLIKIPGIGDYTANALMAIGADLPAICIDANLERVLSRFYKIDALKGLPLKKELKRGFSNGKYLKAVNKYGGRDINESLMDLGREICLSKNPKCQICPLTSSCLARKNNVIDNYPVIDVEKSKKKALTFPLKLLRVLVQKDNKILVYKKPKGSWLEGQLELPTFIVNRDNIPKNQYPLLKNEIVLPDKKFKTLITKYKITNYVLSLTVKEWSNFINEENLSPSNYFFNSKSESQNLSTATFKALR